MFIFKAPVLHDLLCCDITSLRHISNAQKGARHGKHAAGQCWLQGTAQDDTREARMLCHQLESVCLSVFHLCSLPIYVSLQHLAARKQLKALLLGMHLLCEVSRIPNNVALLCAAMFVLPSSSVFCSCSLWDTSHAKVAQSSCVCFALVMT